MSNSDFNRAGSKLIVAAITSNVSPPFRPGDTVLNDWSSAGLVKPSAVRGVLATIDKVDILRTLGALSTSDFCSVEAGIAHILDFALATPPPGP